MFVSIIIVVSLKKALPQFSMEKINNGPIMDNFSRRVED
jgi:hypothetical protein